MAAASASECLEGPDVQVGGRSKEYQTIFTQVSTDQNLRGLATCLESSTLLALTSTVRTRRERIRARLHATPSSAHELGFLQYDKNQSGALEFEELRSVLADLGLLVR